MERIGNIWINDKPKSPRPERKPAGQNPKTKTNIKKIIDKIDGKIKTAKKMQTVNYVSEEGKQYYSGKQIALEDLKTWIQENIKP